MTASSAGCEKPLRGFGRPQHHMNSLRTAGKSRVFLYSSLELTSTSLICNGNAYLSGGRQMRTLVVAVICALNFCVGLYLGNRRTDRALSPGIVVVFSFLAPGVALLVLYAQNHYDFHAKAMEIELSLLFIILGFGLGRFLRGRQSTTVDGSED